tara:strand:+ start:3334 stop:3822 length:489 start_codon:yes stop_codon:yes gene_type:complete
MKRLNTGHGLQPVECNPPVEGNASDKENLLLETQLELPKRVLDYDLRKLKSFKQKQRSYKFASQGKLFIHDLEVVLDQYSSNEHTFDLELLVTVLNIAESFFIHGSDDERSNQKKQSVETLMLKYFKNDSDILDLMIKSVSNKVNKSTYLKRKWQKIKSFFL